MLTILIIILILMAIGALPGWGYAPANWGYYPSGLGLIVIVILIVLLLR